MYLLAENIYLNHAWFFEISLRHFSFFGRNPAFLLKKNNLLIEIFRVFLPQKEALVAIFNETRAPTSIIYVDKQSEKVPILLEV